MASFAYFGIAIRWPSCNIRYESKPHCSPGYGISPSEKISQRTTPYDHLSLAIENSMSWSDSTAIHRRGRGVYNVYILLNDKKTFEELLKKVNFFPMDLLQLFERRLYNAATVCLIQNHTLLHANRR